MKFFDRLWGKNRQPQAKPQQDRDISLVNAWMLAAPPGHAGQVVTVQTAMQVPAIFNSVMTSADIVSSLPWNVYKRDRQGGGHKDTDHPVYRLLNRKPNSIQTSRTYRQNVLVDCLSYGEHFSEIETTKDGSEVLNLWRIDPRMVLEKWQEVVDWETGEKSYELQFWFNDRLLDPEKLVHVVWVSIDGYRGVSPFVMCRDAVSLTIALDRFGSAFMRQGARPSGKLKLPPGMTPEDRRNAQEDWKKYKSGADNAGDTMVLPPGWEWEQVSINPDEAQFNESRLYQLRESQRITRTPPYLSGDYDRMIYANIQYTRLDLVQNFLRPLTTAVDQAFSQRLLDPDGDYYLEHDLHGLLRGSFTEQVQTLQKACGGPVLTVNECRAELGRPPIEGGDDLLSPLNMGGADDDDDQTDQPDDDDQPGDTDETPDNEQGGDGDE